MNTKALSKLSIAILLMASSFTSLGQALGCDNPPIAAVTPLNTFANEGEDVVLTAEIGGGVAPYFVYWANAQGQFLGNGFQVTLSDVQPADSGLIYVMVVDQNGCSTLTAGALFVEPSSPVKPGRRRGHFHSLVSPELIWTIKD